MKFIVSKRHAGTPYDSIWAVITNEVIKVKPELFEYVQYPITTTFEMRYLPRELLFLILKRMIGYYFSVYDFESLAELLVINRSIAELIYQGLYGTGGEIPLVKKVIRIRKTLQILTSIHDGLIINRPVANDRRAYYLRLGRGLSSKWGSRKPTTIQPWEFFNGAYNCVNSGATSVEDVTLKKYFLGPLSGQMCYIDGNFDPEGVLHANHVYHPVITLCLVDHYDLLLPTRNMIEGNDNFEEFADILVMIYGVRTMVNFMIRPDGISPDEDVSHSDVQVVYYIKQ